MPYCCICGKPNVQDAVFCNYCGNQLNTLQRPRERQAVQYEIITLPHRYCKGTGKDTGPLIPAKCRTCDGTGKVSMKMESDAHLVTCSLCKGSGVDPSALLSAECPRCRGTGQVSQKIPII
jgi:DnaJ-class molecular chaperone